MQAVTSCMVTGKSSNQVFMDLNWECKPGRGLDSLFLETERGLIRAGLAKAKEAMEELQQKAMGSSNSVT